MVVLQHTAEFYSLLYVIQTLLEFVSIPLSVAQQLIRTQLYAIPVIKIKEDPFKDVLRAFQVGVFTSLVHLT